MLSLDLSFRHGPYARCCRHKMIHIPFWLTLAAARLRMLVEFGNVDAGAVRVGETCRTSGKSRTAMAALGDSPDESLLLLLSSAC